MIRTFAHHRTIANLMMAAFLLAGLATVPSLRRETFPDFAPVEVEARLPYPGASALEVEETVCGRIEEHLQGIPHLEEVRCDARENLAVVVAEMRDGGDEPAFVDDVRTEVEAVDDLPDAVEAPVIRQLHRTDPVVSVAVTGPLLPVHLEAFCEDVADRLRRDPMLSEVEVLGFSERRLDVRVPAAALLELGLSAQAVADRIAAQSVDLPAGTLETPSRDVLLRVLDERRTPAELEDLLLVAGETGSEVRLGDIARVTETFEREEAKVTLDGERAGLLRIEMNENQDILDVRAALEALLEVERARAPPGVRLRTTQDMSDIVRDRLEMIVKNGAQGLVLVFLTMWLFFDLSVAFWVAMGLPTSFLGALVLVEALGISLNMISLVSLLLALGLVMDDAIVITENIATHVAGGTPAREAVVTATQEVMPGVVSSFMTTVVVFGPLLFLKGDIGEIMSALPAVLILVLGVSILEAFLILPHHLSHVSRAQVVGRPGSWRERFEGGLDRVRQGALGRLVDAAVANRLLTMAVALSLLLLSLSLVAGGFVKFQAFPDLDGNVFEARVLLPQGTPLERTEEVVARILASMDRVAARWSPRQPGGADLVRTILVRYEENPDAGTIGPHLATVVFDLLPSEARVGRLDSITADLRAEVGAVPDVISMNIGEPTLGPAGYPIEVQVRGEDLDEIQEVARDLVGWFSRFEGTSNLRQDLLPGKPELRLRMREGALSSGVTAGDLGAQVRAAFHGATASELRARDASYEVEVRLRTEDLDDRADFEDFRVVLPGGDAAPLGALAELSEGRGWSRIPRIDGLRTASVRGEVDALVVNTRELFELLEAEHLPALRDRHPGVHFVFEGEIRQGRETGRSLAAAFLFGLVGVFVVLSYQFQSYREPFVVMAAIPLAFIGVVTGHLVMGYDLSLPSLIGFVSLAGIVVNDSILLVQFLKMRADQGRDITEAARQASRDRFRAVLLTSLTTIVGLLPLMLERSLQAQVLVPLAISICFGLAASTLLVLVVVPSLYSLLADLGATSLQQG